MVSLRPLVLALLVAVLCVPTASAVAWSAMGDVPVGGSVRVGTDITVVPPHEGVSLATPPADDVPAAFDARLSGTQRASQRTIETVTSMVPADAGLASRQSARIPLLLQPGPAHAAAGGDDAASEPAPGAPTATAALGGFALFWLVFEKLGLARALVALYFRVQPGELLEHERRERVITLVRDRPGIGPSDIAHELGTGWGVTSYHLDRLERAGLVASQRVGHHRCYFLPGAVPREQQRTVGLFRADTTRRIAQLVAKCPGIAQSQLCQELGLSASAASKQLSRLEAASLVRREANGGALRLFPTATLSAAV